MLAKNGHIVYGVDLPEVIGVAKRKYTHQNLNFVTADLSDKFPFEENSFDLVIAFDIIEHMPNDTEFLKRIHAILKKRGKLIIQTPNIGYFPTRLEVLLGIWRRSEYDVHCHIYNFSIIESLFKKCDFKNVKSKGVCYKNGPKKWYYLEKILPKTFNFEIVIIGEKS